MTRIFAPVLSRWRLFAVLASATMLAIAHAFETFGGLAPCLLCLKQREVYWAAGGIGVACMVLVRLWGRPRIRSATDALLGLVFLFGAGVAIYHAGAEWKFWPGPAACAGVRLGVTADDLQALLNNREPYRPPSCEQPAWIFLGLSMAGWNAVASLGLAALSAWAALFEARRR